MPTTTQTALTNIAPQGHNILVFAVPPTGTDVQALVDHLNFVSSATEQKDAIAIVAFSDVVAAEAFAALPAVSHSYRIMCVCYHGAVGLEAEVAAAVGAIISTSTDPALPFNGANLTGIPAVAQQYDLTAERIEQALQNGVAMVRTGADGVPELVRAISTYRYSEDDEQDDLFIDINAALILAYTRKVMRIVSKPFTKGKNTLNRRKALRSALMTQALKLDDAEILQNVKGRAAELTVTEHPTNRSGVVARIPADWVRGMHVIDEYLDVY